MKKTEKLYDYCIEHSDREPEYLAELRRETYLKELRPHMVSGPLQGQLLKMMISLTRPQSVLEIGTFTGYATLCMAAGLAPGAKIYTVEIDKEFSYYHEKYFKLAGLADKIKCIYMDANVFLAESKQQFDFIFMDAGKKDYQQQLELLLTKMPAGGLILADNVLWKGRVIDADHDKMTAQIHEFNQYVAKNPNLENVILPIRDGINLLIVK